MNRLPQLSLKAKWESGKTALMQQIYEMNRDAGVLELVSHCYCAEADFPLKSWRDLFKQLENLQNEGKIRLTESNTALIHLVLTGMATENRTWFTAEAGNI